MTIPTPLIASLTTRARTLVSHVDGARPALLTLTEGDDVRMQEAAVTLVTKGFARVKLIAKKPIHGLKYPGLDIIVPEQSPAQVQLYAEHLFERRKAKGLTKAAAEELVLDPLYFGACMVARGEVDGGVSGAARTTADVLRAGIHCIGPRQPGGTISSFFLMSMPDGQSFTYADAGVVPNPSPEELAEIATSAADAHRALTNEEPRIAFLSYSTLGSAEGQSVSATRQALKIAQTARPDLVMDGELQFDAALVPSVASRKAPKSPVAGRANVFIFPDLASGNIAYKITERLGGATALGPILQGFNGSWMDLSRGCTADDIVLVAALSLVLKG